MIPEPSDPLVVVVVIFLLPHLDFTIVINVMKIMLAADVVLKVDVIINDVVEGEQHGQSSLHVFPSIAIFTHFVTQSSLLLAPDVVKYLVLYLLEWSQMALEIKWLRLRALVLKHLLKTDFIVVIEVHLLEESDILGSVRITTDAHVSAQGLIFLIGDLTVLGARVHIYEVQFCQRVNKGETLIWDWKLGCTSVSYTHLTLPTKA